MENGDTLDQAIEQTTETIEDRVEVLLKYSTKKNSDLSIEKPYGIKRNTKPEQEGDPDDIHSISYCRKHGFLTNARFFIKDTLVAYIDHKLDKLYYDRLDVIYCDPDDIVKQLIPKRFFKYISFRSKTWEKEFNISRDHKDYRKLKAIQTGVMVKNLIRARLKEFRKKLRNDPNIIKVLELSKGKVEKHFNRVIGTKKTVLYILPYTPETLKYAKAQYKLDNRSSEYTSLVDEVNKTITIFKKNLIIQARKVRVDKMLSPDSKPNGRARVAGYIVSQNVVKAINNLLKENLNQYTNILEDANYDSCKNSLLVKIRAMITVLQTIEEKLVDIKDLIYNENKVRENINKPIYDAIHESIKKTMKIDILSKFDNIIKAPCLQHRIRVFDPLLQADYINEIEESVNKEVLMEKVSGGNQFKDELIENLSKIKNDPSATNSEKLKAIALLSRICGFIEQAAENSQSEFETGGRIVKLEVEVDTLPQVETAQVLPEMLENKVITEQLSKELTKDGIDNVIENENIVVIPEPEKTEPAYNFNVEINEGVTNG